MKLRATYRDWEEATRAFAAAFNSRDRVGTVTLAANEATTVVIDPNAGADSVIVLMPTTANAAAALATTYTSVRGKQTFTLAHANNAQTDRTFAYAVIG